MDNFIVSARKYRPQTFNTVVGQSSITNTLKNAIRHNQLAQAFLFCGPRGVGKTTCARILAKTINCEHLSPDVEACDQCPSCKSFADSASFNIYELDGASNNSVDDIRNLVDQVRIPPQVGKYKVYIIDEVHMLSASAFNAFLKTLEEPPPFAKFILATTEKHKILPTILSRCQIFDFRRITVDDMVGHLHFVAGRENIQVEENALHIIAQKADGAMRDALSIFDQLVSFAGNDLKYNTVIENLNVLDYEYYFRITDQILNGDVAATLLSIDDIIGKGFDGQHFLLGFGEHLRNLLVCKDPSTVKLMETAPSIKSRYIDQAAQCQAGQILNLLDINNRCDISYKSSNNKRLHLELAIMQMALSANHSLTAGAAPSNPDPGKKSVNPAKTTSSAGIHPDEQGNSPKAMPPGNTTAHLSKAQTQAYGKAPSAKTVTPVKIKDLKDGVSGMISIKQTPDPTPGNASVSEDSGSYVPAKQFSQEQLNSAWNEFVSTLQAGFPHLYNSLIQFHPVLKDEYMVVISLENKLLETELLKKKSELLDFLRTKLENNKINLTAKVEEHARELRPYTDKDKFGKMAGKNPALLNLKENLDLEIEY
jgi:DNA polymerase-3 subunit gamma/tau